MIQEKQNKLFLIPTSIDQKNINEFLVDWQMKQITHIKHFFVENEKIARLMLKKIRLKNPLQEINLFKIDDHKEKKVIDQLFKNIIKENDFGLLSDAGSPCIADPGAIIVNYSHQKKIKVIPLIGPSSIMMALMSSGFNGQNFRFLGYPPIEKKQKLIFIKNLEKNILKSNETQILIETPYRNDQLLDDLLQNLNEETKICIASNMTSLNEKIISMSVIEWRENIRPSLNKKPCIFLLN